MLAEFKIINDPLRPSVCTNLCSVCYRNKPEDNIKLGCCTYEPEFCLFDLAYLYIYHTAIFQLILEIGQVINGYNGIMIETKSGLNRCPFGTDKGCILPRDAMTPLCRLYICREVAIFAPTTIEERLDEYFTSKEYRLNKFLNEQFPHNEKNITKQTIKEFLEMNINSIKSRISISIQEEQPEQVFTKEINLNDFGRIP